MKKTAVVYWSSTGNTEAMAQAVLEGMKEAGAEAVLLTPDAVDVGALAGMDAIAFGCPAMGSEVLEEIEEAKKKSIPVCRCHTSSASALESILREYCA